jgi:hypothetical protein
MGRNSWGRGKGKILYSPMNSSEVLFEEWEEWEEDLGEGRNSPMKSSEVL